MRSVLLSILLIISLLCTACNATESKNIAENKSTEVSTITLEKTKDVSNEEILTFVDAHGEIYTTVINNNVEKHHYNWDYLENNEAGISYEGDDNYQIRKGIDVSYYQGDIDWNKVKNAGYDFAFIRIGVRGYGDEGILKEDAHFHQNIQAAKSAGLDVGVYFFAQAINETEAIEEANFVLDLLEGYSLELPVVYDPELIRDDDARTDQVSGEQFTLNTIAFCETIEKSGYVPMIYSNMVWMATLFDMEQLQVYPFWYADYEKIPQTPYNFSFWQYSESGSVDGINGNVDLNIQFIEKK